MGTEATHYAMNGIVLKKKEYDRARKRYGDDGFPSEYDDNGYTEKIGRAKDGLSLIADGMNGDYLVFGRIIAKGLEESGLDMTVFPPIKDEDRTLIVERAEAILGIRFDPARVVPVAFTHYH